MFITRTNTGNTSISSQNKNMIRKKHTISVSLGEKNSTFKRTKGLMHKILISALFFLNFQINLLLTLSNKFRCTT